MKNAEQFQILTNHCKMADSRVEPEGEGGNIDEVWEGREISGIVWTKMMAIVMMMNITAVRVMMIFQRILEGRRACLSTGGSETTCPNDSKSCQFTVNIINSQWISWIHSDYHEFTVNIINMCQKKFISQQLIQQKVPKGFMLFFEGENRYKELHFHPWTWWHGWT